MSHESKQQKGGRARAKKLSADDRTLIARKASLTRWSPEKVAQEYPASPFAKHRGQIDLGGNSIDCYVLDTGERVLSSRGFLKTIADADNGKLGEYLGISGLKPFINKDLIAGEIIDFNIPGGAAAKGITSDQFESICRAFIQALYKGTLTTERQKEIAIRCALIVAGLTRTGLDALIDEATGYQYIRAEDALQVKLRAFISEELRAWEKTFPDDLWEEFGRLTNWQGSLHHRPKWWGKLVVELIYDTLDKDVAEYLKNNKPEPGTCWHQQLTDNYGVRQLVSRCYEVIGVAKTCSSIKELREKVNHLYGKEAVQYLLYLPRAQ